MGNCLYLSPGQSLIELGFNNEDSLGSNIGHIAIGNGAYYRAVSVEPAADAAADASLMMEGGVVDVNFTMQTIHELLNLTGSLTWWTDWVSIGRNDSGITMDRWSELFH